MKHFYDEFPDKRKESWDDLFPFICFLHKLQASRIMKVSC